MRISDWSSDVCSSDLLPTICGSRSSTSGSAASLTGVRDLPDRSNRQRSKRPRLAFASVSRCVQTSQRPSLDTVGAEMRLSSVRSSAVSRSEEHTSELQSLMRESYAVFCLKKKNIKKEQVSHNHKNTIKHIKPKPTADH